MRDLQCALKDVVHVSRVNIFYERNNFLDEAYLILGLIVSRENLIDNRSCPLFGEIRGSA